MATASIMTPVGGIPAAWRDGSDDEADGKLHTTFPNFYYGQVLKYSQLERREGTGPLAAAAAQKPARAVRKRKLTADTSTRADPLAAIETRQFVWRKFPESTKKRKKAAEGARTPSGSGAQDAEDAEDEAEDEDAEVEDAAATAAADTIADVAAQHNEGAALHSQLNWEDSVVWGDDQGTSERRSEQDAAAAAAAAAGKRRRPSVKAAFRDREKSKLALNNASLDDGAGVAAPEPTDEEEKFKGTKEKQDKEERLKVKAVIEVPGEIASSMFPPSNDYLASGRWMDMIGWDTDVPIAEVDPQVAAVNIDLNDEELLLGATIDRPVWMRRPNRLMQQTGRNRIPTWQLRQKEKSMEAAKRKRARDGLPSPTGEATGPSRDPFNISNDRYHARDGQTQTTNLALKNAIGKSVVEHSMPSKRLDPLTFKYDWTDAQKSMFHREPLRKERYSGKDKAQSKIWKPLVSMEEDGGPAKKNRSVQHGKLWKAKDLHALDGELVLAEYSEEHPLVVQNPGMCTQVKNYYKQESQKDTNKPKFVHGPTLLVGPSDASPFLGKLEPREAMQSFENNLFRAPIYLHEPLSTDFLVIRKSLGYPDEEGDKKKDHHERFSYSIRRITNMYTVGQIMPKVEVPRPLSKQCKDFQDNRMSVHIQREFLPNKKGVRPAIKTEQIKSVFPSYTDMYIRQRIKEFAVTLRDYRAKRGSNVSEEIRNMTDTGQWVWNEDNGDNIVTQTKLEKELTPDDVCAYEAMLASAYRLKEMGWNSEEYRRIDANQDSQKWTVEDEVSLAPWVLTADFLSYLKDKGLICVTGKGEPTGCSEAFNYMRKPHKPVESHAPESKLLPHSMQGEQKKQAKLAGTNADLRKLKLPEVLAMLRSFGVSEEKLKKRPSEIQKPGEYRWRMVACVREENTRIANENEDGSNRFAREEKSTHAKLQDDHRDECNRIFKLQNQVLRSDEVLSSEGEDSDSDSIDAGDARQLEDMASRQTGAGARVDNTRAKKENKLLEEMRKNLQGSSASQAGTENSSAKSGIGDGASTVASTAKPKQRVLIITRTIGRTIKKERVHNQDVIDTYLAKKALGGGHKSQSRANFKKEQRRIENELARIKKQDEAEAAIGSDGRGSPALSTKSGPAKAPKHTLKCSKCGAIGHTKASKKCPHYRNDDADDYMTPTALEEGVTELQGTTLTIGLSKLKVKEKEDKKRKREMERRMLQQEAKKAKKEEQKRLTTARQKSMAGLTAEEMADPRYALHFVLGQLLDIAVTYDVTYCGGTFAKPVDKAMYAEYYRIVPKPMDLSKVHDNVKKRAYRNRIAFINDFRQMASNAMLFNGPEHAVYTCGSNLRMKIIDECEKRDAELKLQEVALGTYEEVIIDKDDEQDGDFERSDADQELAKTSAGL